MIEYQIKDCGEITKRSLRNRKIEYIVIHFYDGWTADERCARDLEPNNSRICHYYIDNVNIIRTNNPNLWVVRHLKDPSGILRNENSVGIMVCYPKHNVPEQAFDNLAAIIADLVSSLRVPIDHVLMDPDEVESFEEFDKNVVFFDKLESKIKEFTKQTVSGSWGIDTTLKLQQYFDLPQTGFIKHQDPYKSYNARFTSGWLYDSSGLGDPLIAAMQLELGVNPSGVIDLLDYENDFCMKLMERYGAITLNEAITFMQNKLNDGRF